MKIFFAFAVFSIATVLGLSLPMSQGKIDIAALEKAILSKDGRASNALGKLFASYINKFVADLGDPTTLLNETGIEIPVFLNDSIHINGIINATDVELAGHGQLNITDAFATLIPLGVELTFYLPEIVLSGQYLIDLLETSLFPLTIYGDGPFTVKISSTTLHTKIKLGTTLTGHLKMNSLTYDLDVYEIVGRVEGLFSDIDESGELNEAVNILFNSYASILFNMFEANLHDNLTELVMDIGNEILGNLTLADIIGGGGGKIPVELFELPQQ